MANSNQLARAIIDAIPGALGITPDPWPDAPDPNDGEPHRTVTLLIDAFLQKETDGNQASTQSELKQPEYRSGTNNLTDAPFQLPPSLIMANAAVSISPSPGISVEAIERVLAKEDNEYTNEAERMLRRIRDLLQSGEYALISKEDRESAFSLAWDGALKLGNGEDGEAEACERESRKLLHLESL